MRLKRKKRIRKTKQSGSLRILQAKTAVFVTFSDGFRRIYRNRDQDPSYGRVRIPDPRTVSYMNLFVNAVLQPSSVYRVSRGKLKLRSPELPEKGVPIMLQFVTILGKHSRGCRGRKTATTCRSPHKVR
ncbi:DUF4183 domain-containing protein [Paenibacillus chitinolyticus]|uniref:DUF4183 domain-containing protein n=1 Tax=Paenibacillus chitinolyticus TaxID=79263 RepID=UPI003558C7CB